MVLEKTLESLGLQGDQTVQSSRKYKLECEAKWALGSITMNKGSGGNGIPVELFQMLKDDTVKVLHSICQQIVATKD